MATRKKLTKWQRVTAVRWTFVFIRLLALLIFVWPASASYWNTLTTLHEAPSVPRLLALGVAALPDLLMSMSLVKISAKRLATHRVSHWVVASFWFGLVMSMAANLNASYRNGVVDIVVSVLLPVFVMLDVEMVKYADATFAKKRKPAKSKAPAKAPVTAVGTSGAQVGALVPAMP